MDKRAANDHLVALQKDIKSAKAMVAGNLIRKVKKLKEEKETLAGDSEKVRKIDTKVERTLEEVKLLKSLDSYTIAKQATLQSEPKHWKKLIDNEKASMEDRLTALVATKTKVNNRVAQFRSDNKDCDEWLTEYFEFREGSKELKLKPKINKKKKIFQKAKFNSNKS